MFNLHNRIWFSIHCCKVILFTTTLELRRGNARWKIKLFTWSHTVRIQTQLSNSWVIALKHFWRWESHSCSKTHEFVLLPFCRWGTEALTLCKIMALFDFNSKLFLLYQVASLIPSPTLKIILLKKKVNNQCFSILPLYSLVLFPTEENFST